MKKYALTILIAISAFLVVGLGGYFYGRASAKEVCLEESIKREKAIQEHLAKISGDLTDISKAYEDQEVQLKSDMSEILARLKKSPVSVIKNGKCTPSPTFLNSIDQAIDRANKK